MLPAIFSERQRIQNIIELSDSLSPDSILLRSEWAKCLAIVSSGYIEEALRIILQEYIRTRAEPAVARFASGKLRDFQNPSPGNLEKILALFDPQWLAELNEFWRDERRDSIASVVNNRHNAAHGRHFSTGLVTIVRYHKAADEVVVFLHDLILVKS